MDEVLIKLNVELIFTLARVTGKLNNRRSRECSLLLTRTCYLAQRHTVKLVKNFFGVKDIKEARQRLDRLIQEEVATATAQTLGVDRLSSLDSEASMDGLRKVPGTFVANELICSMSD